MALSKPQQAAVDHAYTLFLREQAGYRSGVHPFAKFVLAHGGFETTVNEAGETVETPCISGELALEHLGWGPEDMQRECIAAGRAGEPLRREVLDAFVHEDCREEFYESLYDIIAGDPEEVVDDLDEISEAWANGLRADGTTPRTNGSLKRESIEIYHVYAQLFFKVLDELRRRRRKHHLDAFDHWRKDDVPSFSDLDALDVQSIDKDRSAPPLLAARRVIAELNQTIEQRRRTRKGRARLLMPLRDRAVLALMIVLGIRKGVLRRALVGDLHFAEETAFAGVVAVLYVRLGSRRKGKGRIVRKLVPPLVAQWLQEYLDAAGIADQPETPLVRPVRIDRRHLPLTLGAISLIPVRYFEKLTGRRYSPHTMRHLAEKLAFLAGIDWFAEHRQDLLFRDEAAIEMPALPSDPQFFVDALVDRLRNTNMPDRYKDNLRPPSAEWGGWIASCGALEYLVGERGARLVPDRQGIAEAERQLASAQQDAIRKNSELAAIEQSVEIEVASLSRHDVVKTLLRALRAGREAGEAKAAVVEARQALEAARARRVAAPDDADPSELEAEVEEEEIGLDADEPLVMRLLGTPREFRWAFGENVLPASTLRRYKDGKLPFPPGDPRNLFDPNPDDPRLPPKCIVRLSRNRWWIRLDLLDWTRYPVAVQERLDEIMRRPQPLPEHGRLPSEEELAVLLQTV